MLAIMCVQTQMMEQIVSKKSVTFSPSIEVQYISSCLSPHVLVPNVEQTQLRQQEEQPRTKQLSEQFHDVVKSVQVALNGHGAVWASEVAKEADAWCIRAYIEPEKLERSQARVRGQAQNALLAAAAESESACLLGYHRAPFTLLPSGFRAVLVERADSMKICIDAFSLGCCQKPDCCPLLHPTCHVEVRVEFVPQENPGGSGAVKTTGQSKRRRMRQNS
jgi:hypothetical protein